MTYKHFMDSLKEESKEKEIPFIGNIELTGLCNLKCKMCYVINEDGDKDLTTEEWNLLLRDAVKAGMGEAYLSGGEPLLRNDFEELYCKLYDLGTRIMILTNGILLDEKLVEIFKKRPPEGISITLYGCDNESYETITGCPDGFDKVMSSIEKSISNNLPLSLKVPALKPLLNQYNLFSNIANRYNLKMSLGKYISPVRGCTSLSNNWRLSPKEINDIIPLIEGKDRFVYAPTKRTGKVSDCNCGKGRFAICYDGRLVGCLSYTELCTYPLIDGFTVALSKLREMIDKQEDFCQACKECEYVNKCSLCPGVNYAETGSLCKCSDYRKSLAQYGVL